MASHILEVIRNDCEGHVLLNVTSGLHDELDLEIEGTEGTTPFSTKCQSCEHILRQLRLDYKIVNHHQVTAALNSLSSIQSDEWDNIVRHLLLQWDPSCIDSGFLPSSIELSAQIIDGEYLVLIFRKNISGIHRRVAEIKIPKTEDRELDTVAWISIAVARSTSLESKSREQAKIIKKLEEQLRQLLQAKESYEIELLEKSAVLLNSKKLKIRNQRRLLNETGQRDSLKGSSSKGVGDEKDSDHHSEADGIVQSRIRKRKNQDEREDKISEQENPHFTDAEETMNSGSHGNSEDIEVASTTDDDLESLEDKEAYSAASLQANHAEARKQRHFNENHGTDSFQRSHSSNMDYIEPDISSVPNRSLKSDHNSSSEVINKRMQREFDSDEEL